MKKVYPFSIKKLESIKKRFVYLRLFLPFILIIFVIYNPQFSQSSIQSKIIVFILTLVTIEAILFVQPKIMLKKISEKKVIIDNVNVEIDDGKYKKTIAHKDINKMCTIFDQTESVVGLKIFYSGKTLSIDYIDQPSDFIQSIKPFLSENTIFIDKSINTIWQNPVLAVLITTLTAFTIIYFRKVGGEFSYDFFSALFSTAIGLIFLIFRPFSKQTGKRFRKFESVLGYLMVGSGLLLLLILLI